jgi:hypothetical protein
MTQDELKGGSFYPRYAALVENSPGSGITPGIRSHLALLVVDSRSR